MKRARPDAEGAFPRERSTLRQLKDRLVAAQADVYALLEQIDELTRREETVAGIRRSFAELPANVLLAIMDLAPDSKCVPFPFHVDRQGLTRTTKPNPNRAGRRPSWRAPAATSASPTPRAGGRRSTPSPATCSSRARDASGASWPPATASSTTGHASNRR